MSSCEESVPVLFHIVTIYVGVPISWSEDEQIKKIKEIEESLGMFLTKDSDQSSKKYVLYSTRQKRVLYDLGSDLESNPYDEFSKEVLTTIWRTLKTYLPVGVVITEPGIMPKLAAGTKIIYNDLMGVNKEGKAKQSSSILEV